MFTFFHVLFHFSDFSAVFTNLGASGRYGPTTLGSHYTGQDHDGQVTLSSGIQQWIVPYTGDYRIEAIGAAGGVRYTQLTRTKPRKRSKNDWNFQLIER